MRNAQRPNGWLPIVIVSAAVIVSMVFTGCGGPELSGGAKTVDPASGGGSPSDIDMQEPASADWQALGEAVKTEEEKAGTITKRLDMKVYFAFDRSAIGVAERAKLDSLAEYLKEHTNYDLIIEGHADKRGSAEYNRGLSERRALAVKEYLTTQGVDSERIETVAYGEEKPAVKNASTPEEYKENRRAAFIVEAQR